VLKAKIFKGKHEPKLEFPEGSGVQTNKILHGGICQYGYFLEQHDFNCCSGCFVQCASYTVFASVKPFEAKVNMESVLQTKSAVHANCRPV